MLRAKLSRVASAAAIMSIGALGVSGSPVSAANTPGVVAIVTTCDLAHFPNVSTPNLDPKCNSAGGLLPNTAVGVTTGLQVINSVTFSNSSYNETCPPAIGGALGTITSWSGPNGTGTNLGSEDFSWTRVGLTAVIFLTDPPAVAGPTNATGAAVGILIPLGAPSGDPTCAANGGQGGFLQVQVIALGAWIS